VTPRLGYAKLRSTPGALRHDPMAQDLISKKTRYEFREHLVDFSVIREIQAHFDNADISYLEDAPAHSGQRRTCVERYYASLDFAKADDVAKLCRAFGSIMEELENSNPFLSESETARRLARRDTLVKWLRKDGYDYQSGRVFRAGQLPTASELTVLAADFDAP
jgi:hypothetical protein